VITSLQKENKAEKVDPEKVTGQFWGQQLKFRLWWSDKASIGRCFQRPSRHKGRSLMSTWLRSILGKENSALGEEAAPFMVVHKRVSKKTNRR
jgi:hypothetical protein